MSCTTDNISLYVCVVIFKEKELFRRLLLYIADFNECYFNSLFMFSPIKIIYIFVCVCIHKNRFKFMYLTFIYKCNLIQNHQIVN